MKGSDCPYSRRGNAGTPPDKSQQQSTLGLVKCPPKIDQNDLIRVFAQICQLRQRRRRGGPVQIVKRNAEVLSEIPEGSESGVFASLNLS